MTVQDLNRFQLVSLKQRYLCEKYRDVSYGELVSADELVSDEEIEKCYGDVYFAEDDF